MEKTINRKLATLATALAITLGGLAAAPSAAANAPAARAWCSYTLGMASSGAYVEVRNVVCTGGRQVAPVIRVRDSNGYRSVIGAFVQSGSSRVNRPGGTIAVGGWAVVD